MELMKFNLADVNASLLHWSIKVVTHAPHHTKYSRTFRTLIINILPQPPLTKKKPTQTNFSFLWHVQFERNFLAQNAVANDYF
jgi:hypothetical protein